METAIQEAFRKIEEEFNIKIHPVAKEIYLEKEKQQIIESYDLGIKDFCNHDPERHGNEIPSGEQYYNEHYKNKIT